MYNNHVCIKVQIYQKFIRECLLRPKLSETFHIKFIIHRHTPFHRIVSGYWCQGGDVTKFDGTGSTSIYGDSFDKENSNLRHIGPGILSTCNNNDGKYDSKFNLTFKCLETVDDKTVFGRVIHGLINIYKVTVSFFGNLYTSIE